MIRFAHLATLSALCAEAARAVATHVRFKVLGRPRHISSCRGERIPSDIEYVARTLPG